jgi:hypothetical protein
MRLVVTAIAIILISISLINVLGPLVGSAALPWILKIDPTMGKDAGEILVLISILQVSILVAVIYNKWQGIKPLIAGALAGLLLAPFGALRDINSTIKKICQGENYSILETNTPEVTNLLIENKVTSIPTSLMESIKIHQSNSQILIPEHNHLNK